MCFVITNVVTADCEASFDMMCCRRAASQLARHIVCVRCATLRQLFLVFCREDVILHFRAMFLALLCIFAIVWLSWLWLPRSCLSASHCELKWLAAGTAKVCFYFGRCHLLTLHYNFPLG